jgi:hypothetical protein
LRGGPGPRVNFLDLAWSVTIKLMPGRKLLIPSLAPLSFWEIFTQTLMPSEGLEKSLVHATAKTVGDPPAAPHQRACRPCRPHNLHSLTHNTSLAQDGTSSLLLCGWSTTTSVLAAVAIGRSLPQTFTSISSYSVLPLRPGLCELEGDEPAHEAILPVQATFQVRF